MTQVGTIGRRRTLLGAAVVVAVIGLASPVYGDEGAADEAPVTETEPTTPPTTDPDDHSSESPVVAVGLPPVPPVVESPVVAVGLPPVPPVVEPPVVAVGLPPVPSLSGLATTVDAALRLIDDCL